MAKKLHPLDVRYKGPSTAYIGKPRRKDRVIRSEGMDPVVLPEPVATPKPAAPPSPEGPWATPARPAPPSPPRPSMAPPPLPYSAAAPAPHPARRGKAALGRVILMLLAIAALVALVRVFSAPMELRMIEMPTSNRDAINL